MPAGPLMSYVVLAFFLFLLVALAEDATTRISILILPVWFLLLAFLYFGRIRKTTHHISRRQGHLDKVAKEKTAAAAFLSESR
jgi:D-serine/D-alanine/glycine transporter